MIIPGRPYGGGGGNFWAGKGAVEAITEGGSLSIPPLSGILPAAAGKQGVENHLFFRKIIFSGTWSKPKFSRI
jgi:hypothetical protein